MGKSASCQDTLRKLILSPNDTVVLLSPKQLKTLNSQIALLIERNNTCTETINKANEIIEQFHLNETGYQEIIDNQKEMISNKDSEISNVNEIMKNKKKASFRRFLYGTGGGLAVGLITGIVIAM